LLQEDRNMIFSTRATGLVCAGMLLAAVAAVAPRSAALAADASRGEAAGKRDAAALTRLIDRAIEEQQLAAKASPAPLADDSEFLRRAYLDITGVIPPADKTRAFLDSTQPDKRSRLIDDLLASPDYGRHMGDVWQDLLMAQRDILTRGLDAEPLANWLATSFNSNKPWDRLVTELLTATGTQEQNGATTFYLAHRSADRLTDPVCRLFLGIQLQCAQCHNHPYTSWKRTDYWGMAAFFTRVDDGAPPKLAKASTPPNVRELSSVAKKRLPTSALSTPPTLLGGEVPRMSGKEPYRPVLARWLTSAKNPYFARAKVNRVWAQFFGRGLINPVDNLSEESRPSHPELFEALAQQFIDSGFDVKNLIRGICNSRAYQRASTPAGKGPNAEALYTSMMIKPMSPEQLYDSLVRVLGTEKQKKRDKTTKSGKKKGPAAGPRGAFVDFFRPAEGADPHEYPAGIPQVLRLMNSDWTGKVSAFVSRTVKDSQPPARNIEALLLVTLSRRPTAAETERLTKHVQASGGKPAKAYEDILWALLNCSEFALNH
jgi:hypothetical protein